MKKRFLSLGLALALLLTACGGPAAPASPETPPPSQSSAPPSSQEPAPVEPPPEEEPELSPPETGFVPVEQLNDKARQELSRYNDWSGFLEWLEEDALEKTYCYLFVVNESGTPVANIQCYANERDFSLVREPEFDFRIGLSRNSGLLPIEADFLEPTLYLCNRDIAVPYYKRPVVQQVNIDKETMEQMREGKILQVVWGEEAPSETILSVDHISVTVKDANGNPAADHVVYIHFCWEDTQPKAEYGDIGFGDTFYEPRYTDANGVARFVMDNTFRPEGDREVVVIPSYEEPKSPKKKAVRLRVGDEPPSEFEVTLD